MALLSGKYSLLGIEDVEAFAARIVDRRRLDWLLPHERDDLVVWLVEECWRLSLRFSPQGYPFSQWVRPTLERRVVDWLRSPANRRLGSGRTRWKFGDSEYERPLTEVVSLDADDSERDRLGALVAGGSLESGEHRLAAELRDLEARARRPGRGADRLGDTAA
jgi:hypothetical protein